MAKSKNTVQQPKMGDVVFWRTRIRQRPAMVTQVWSETTLNLFILPDATDDHQEGMNWLGYCRTSVERGEGVGQWTEVLDLEADTPAEAEKPQ